MNRKDTLVKNTSLYWTISVYNSSGVLIDADSTPSVVVRKNGVATADSVTVTKRSGATGKYDCVYDPAGEAEGDQFTIEETITVSSQDYEASWEVTVIDPERGTEGANTTTPPTTDAIRDAVLNKVIVNSLTVDNILQYLAAVLLGKLTTTDLGGGNYSLVFKDAGGTTTRITATVDNVGDRSSVTLETI